MFVLNNCVEFISTTPGELSGIVEAWPRGGDELAEKVIIVAMKALCSAIFVAGAVLAFHAIPLLPAAGGVIKTIMAVVLMAFAHDNLSAVQSWSNEVFIDGNSVLARIWDDDESFSVNCNEVLKYGFASGWTKNCIV